MIEIEEIDEAKIRRWTDERDFARATLLSRLSVEKVRQNREAAERHLRYMNTQSQLRAITMRGEGKSLAVIAEWLNVGVGTVRRWLKSDVEFLLTGGLQKRDLDW